MFSSRISIWYFFFFFFFTICISLLLLLQSQTWLSNFTFTFHFHALEKEMAPHSSTLAWKIPWTEKPGRLRSMGSLRVGHDWVTSLSFFTFMHWRRKCQPTPVFLPGESQVQGSLVGCRLWGLTESDTTAATQQQQQQQQNSFSLIPLASLVYFPLALWGYLGQLI